MIDGTVSSLWWELDYAGTEELGSTIVTRASKALERAGFECRGEASLSRSEREAWEERALELHRRKTYFAGGDRSDRIARALEPFGQDIVLMPVLMTTFRSHGYAAQTRLALFLHQRGGRELVWWREAYFRSGGFGRASWEPGARAEVLLDGALDLLLAELPHAE